MRSDGLTPLRDAAPRDRIAAWEILVVLKVLLELRPVGRVQVDIQSLQRLGAEEIDARLRAQPR